MPVISMPKDHPAWVLDRGTAFREELPQVGVRPFFDGLGMCIGPARVLAKLWFEQELSKFGPNTWPIGTGASGAILLGMLDRGSYIRPQFKDYGPLWRSLAGAKWNQDNGFPIVLVDDCIVSGGTMRYMHRVCEAEGLTIAADIVLMGDYPDANTR